MSNLLSGLLRVAGAGVQGYGADKDAAVKEALAQAAETRKEHLDAIKELIARRTLRTPVLGDPNYAPAMGAVAGAEATAKVPAAIQQAAAIAPIDVKKATDIATAVEPIKVKTAVDTAAGVAPIKVKQALDTATGVAPVARATHAANRQFDVDHPLKATTLTPDQIKASTVNDLAGPAADALIAYHGGEGGVRQNTAAALSHIPFAGNYLEGKTDPAFQAAMNNARVLGTQYLEIMPKSRFQPSTIDDIMKQIAPNAGDAPQVKAQKIARIKVLKAAIAKRAANPVDVNLDDAPQPPGAEP